MLAAPRTKSWLFGPLPDLLLGCGLGYAAIFLLLGVLRPDMAAIDPWGPFVILAFSVPHYGATILRVYEQRESRRKYVLFAVHATLLLWALYALASHHATLGSWLITIYLSWSPWHYAAQNYGLSLMFLRRRGVEVTPLAKRLLHASFALSFGLVFLSFHAAASSDAADVIYAGGAGYRFLPLGIPEPVATPLFWIVAGLDLLAAGGAVALLVAKTRASALLPTVTIMATQALWFSVPKLLAYGGGAPIRKTAMFAFLWVAVGHAVQYLWVTTYFASVSRGFDGRARYLGKALLAGTAVWILPAVLFAPGALGGVPFDAGLGLLTAAIVNLHHFVLDGAIWKLRDGRIAQILIRSEAATDGPVTPSRPWVRGLVWAAGAIACAIWVVGAVEDRAGHEALAAGDSGRLARSAERLAFIGRDTPRFWTGLGDLALSRGDGDTATREFERSLGLLPTASAWAGMGDARALRGEWRPALEAYEAAIALNPRHVGALDRAGMIYLRLGDRPRARDALSRAAALAPLDSEVREHRALASRETPNP